MKRYLIILILICVLALPAMAMIIQEPISKDIEGNEIKPIDQLRIPINKPVFTTKPVVYNEEITLIKRMVTIFSDLTGLKQDVIEEPQTTINVEIDDQIVAIIPKESEFNGMEIHNVCLAYQYGTTNWYKCEQDMVSL